MPRTDPYPAFNYLIDIGKVTAGGFSEASGLDIEIQPIDYRNGDEDFVPRKLPGIKKHSHIKLARGIIGDLDLFKWLYSGMIGQVDRREGAIILRDEQRNEVMRWKFTRGWATKLTGPTLKGDGNAVAIETLEIAHESLEVILPG
jgi:phage tail-like protein